MDVELFIILFYYAFNVHDIKEMTPHFNYNLFYLCLLDLAGEGSPGYRFINSSTIIITQQAINLQKTCIMRSKKYHSSLLHINNLSFLSNSAHIN